MSQEKGKFGFWQLDDQATRLGDRELAIERERERENMKKIMIEHLINNEQLLAGSQN